MQQFMECEVCGGAISPDGQSCRQCQSPVGNDVEEDASPPIDNEKILLDQGIEGEEAQQVLNFMENNPGVSAKESLRLIGEIYSEFGAHGINLGEKPDFLKGRTGLYTTRNNGMFGPISLKVIGISACGVLLIALIGLTTILIIK